MLGKKELQDVLGIIDIVGTTILFSYHHKRPHKKDTQERDKRKTRAFNVILKKAQSPKKETYHLLPFPAYHSPPPPSSQP